MNLKATFQNHTSFVVAWVRAACKKSIIEFNCSSKTDRLKECRTKSLERFG